MDNMVDRVNSQHYIPSVYAHTKDVKLVTDSMSAGDVWVGNYEWN